MVNTALRVAIVRCLGRLHPTPMVVGTLRAEVELMVADRSITSQEFDESVAALGKYITRQHDDFLGVETCALTEAGLAVARNVCR